MYCVVLLIFHYTAHALLPDHVMPVVLQNEVKRKEKEKLQTHEVA